MSTHFDRFDICAPVRMSTTLYMLPAHILNKLSRRSYPRSDAFAIGCSGRVSVPAFAHSAAWIYIRA